ncbi:MAG: protein kinase, partial [Pirellulaceae bacterium]|nr:protein kinase [Pirellulaceae bacterium]
MNERAIFDTALDLEDEQQRSAYLDAACSGDSQLRQHIDRLLDACPRLGSFLEHPPRPELPAVPPERPGEWIGNYKLLEQIGEGGFGVVYLAEQQQPVRRPVALKIIKPGMDSRAVIARFEAERQALAMMDHPNIARVLDAGTTQSGRPYFVMELVRGASITDYCDQNRLTLVERLRLFVPVCRAIQHAHQKGVIHRDIKPSNVLVSLCDGKPVPKVIDFGVAKAVSHRLADETLRTLHGQIIGTLEYMSPEQAETGSLDIDTRSDVYSLGVLLYELLTGSTPLPRARLANATWDQVLRLIREHEPATPSQRLSQSGDALPDISAQRRTEPRRLAALVRGELDWVVMKALEKSRNRRYATALDLAADVERYLSHEPVTACPPSWVYRCRKLALKHARLVLPLGALILVLLVAGPVSIWQAIRATRAEVAVRGQRDAAQRATGDADLARRELWAAYRQLAAEQQRTTRLRDVAVRNEARLAAEKGENFVQRGELREGLLWLATSLNKLPAEETALRRAIQANLAAVLDDMPRPLLSSPLKTGEGAHLDFRTEVGQPELALLVTVAGQPPISHVASWNAGDARFSTQALGDVVAPRLESLRFGASATRFVGLAPGAEIVFGDLNLPVSRYQRYPWSGAGFSQLFVNARRDRLLAICWEPQRVELFDLHAGQRISDPLAPEAGQFQPPRSGDGPFSSDGSSFALLRQVPELADDGQPATGLLLHRWRADDGQPLGPATRLPPGDGWRPEYPIRIGPRAATLVRYVQDSTSRAPRYQLSNATTGDAIGDAFGDATGLTAMALAPDGLVLAAAAGQPGLQCTTIRLWNLARPGDLLGTFSVPASVSTLRFGPDGRTLFLAGRSPAAIWSVPEPRATRQILPHTSPLESVEVSRDGQTVLTITGGHAARWSATTGELLGHPLPLPHSDSAASLPAAFRPDGQQLVIAEGADVHRLDADSGLPAGSPLRAPHHVVRVAYSADGQRILCVCSVDETKGEVLVYDDQTGRPVGSPVPLLAVFSPDKQALRRGGAAISPDGRTVLVTDRLDRLRIWPVDGQGEPRGAIPTRGELSDVRFTPDGNRVLTVTGQHLIEFWDAPAGSRVGRPALLDLPVRAVAISRDGRLLATAHGDTLTCRFVETGGILGRPWRVADVTSLCFSDDGQTLYAGLATGLVRAFRVSHSIPAEALVLDHAETTTGSRLTDDGILEDLPAAAWRERLVR